LGLFNAITNHTYATFKDTVTGLTRRELTEPLTNYNVVVADKQWKNNSSVYFINTNVTRGGGFNDADVVGAGFNLMNKKTPMALKVHLITACYLYQIHRVKNLKNKLQDTGMC